MRVHLMQALPYDRDPHKQHQPFHAPQELRANQPQITGDAR
jgi:hypothetical protein